MTGNPKQLPSSSVYQWVNKIQYESNNHVVGVHVCAYPKAMILPYEQYWQLLKAIQYLRRSTQNLTLLMTDL